MISLSQPTSAAFCAKARLSSLPDLARDRHSTSYADHLSVAPQALSLVRQLCVSVRILHLARGIVRCFSRRSCRSCSLLRAARPIGTLREFISFAHPWCQIALARALCTFAFRVCNPRRALGTTALREVRTLIARAEARELYRDLLRGSSHRISRRALANVHVLGS